MAERISGLSISLDLETAQVDRSLSQIKRSFRSLQKSASVNMNNMKFDSKDITTYKKNLDALSKSYDSQKQNVDDIKKRMDQMTAAGKDNTEAFKDLNGEYNRQVDELNKLGHALEKAEDGLRGVYNESSRLAGVRDAFSGISGSLKTVGGNLQNVGGQIQSVGGSLTRSITMPALAAVTAVGGLTAALGWGRLTGLDSAQAQLKGLGYSTEEVGRISDQVTSAIEGGMTTMAEGTSIAAGALAAGVDEGAELEKYIKLVGDAAVGANRPVSDMASIFNRVQGMGKLMTEELNMIEDGMPGFAMAMSEHLGVSQEEFRKMVTAGEVSSEDFLTVMDSFAGNMAAAYSDSWKGMVANTKAYIGIIGENLLSGVFEQSKESIAEFIEFLKSPEVVEWAKTTGAAIGETFSNIVTKIQEGITWFKSLDTEQQKLIGKLGLIAVAAGPVLTVLGGITVFVGSVVSALGGMFGVLASVAGGLAKFSGGLKMVSSGAQTLSQAFPKLGAVVGFVSKAFSAISSVFMRVGGFIMPLLSKGFTLVRIGLVALTGPVGIVIGVISALAAGFVFAYKRSETFRNFIGNIGQMFSNAWQSIASFKDKVVSAFQGIFALFKGDVEGGIDILRSLGLSDEMIQRIYGVVQVIQRHFYVMKARIQLALSAVKTVFTSVFTAVSEWWAANGPAITGAISSAFQKAKDIVGVALTAVKTVFTTVFNAVKSWWDSNGQAIIGGVVSTFNWLKETVGLALNLVLAIIKRVFKIGQGIFSVFSTVVSTIWKTLWNVLLEAVRIFAPIVQGIWNTLWSVIKNTIQIFAPIISGIVKTAINIITETFRIFKPIVLGIWNTLWPVVVNVIQGAWSRMKLIVGIGMDLIQGIIRTATALINGNWSAAWEAIRSTLSSIKDRIVLHITEMKNRSIALIQQLVGGAIQWFQNMWSNLTQKATDLKNVVVLRFHMLRASVISTIIRLVGTVGKWFIDLYNNTRTRVTNLRNSVVNLFTSLKDGAVNRVRGLYNSVRSWFQKIYNNISDRMRSAKDTAVRFATNMKDGAINQFNNLADGARDMMDKVGQWIDNKKQAVVDKATSLGTGIANAAIGGFNKMIGGINNVASMLGFNGNLISKIPTYSRGTKNHKGGLAVVGDKGPGNGPGAGGSGTREIVQTPDKKQYLFDTETMLNLPKGSKVFKNKDTEGMLAGSGVKDWFAGKAKSIGDFAKNTFNSAKDKVSGAFNNVKGFVSDIWDYATDPGKLVGDMMSKLDFGWDLPTHALEFAKLGVNKLKDTVVDYVKGLFDKAGGMGDGSHILGKSITQTFGRYTGGINFNGGRHYGVDTAHVYDKLLSPVNGVITKIWRDYGGGNSIQMKAGKYNWWFMHMKNIAKKVGDSIKSGDFLGTTGNTGNFTTGPHLHTQVMEGGIGNKFAIDPAPVLKNLKQHAKGGFVNKGGLFNLHDDEYVIPMNHPSEAMKLLALAGKQLAGNSKQTRELPNVGGSGGNDNKEMLDALLQIVNNQQKQIDQTTQALQLLLGIKQKTGITQQQIVDAYDEHDFENQTLNNIFRGRKGGGPVNV